MERTPDQHRCLQVNACHDLSLFECGKEKCLAVKDIISYAKTYHVLHFVLSGKGYLELEGNKYELVKGDFFYIPPMREAHYYPDAREPWTYTWFGFAGTIAAEYLALCRISAKNPVFSQIRDNSLNDWFNELVYSYHHAGFLDVRCLGYVYLIFAVMIEHGNANPTPALSTKQSHVKEAKEYIAYNFQLPIRVTDIAASVNLTANYLSNIFQETLGVSPKQYLTRFRIEQACTMLGDATVRIKDVAARVGYKNQMHFSKEFKNARSISPKSYQENLKSELERGSST